VINQEALQWLRHHWSPEYIETNCWVAVSGDGLIAMDPDFSVVVEKSGWLPIDSVVFAYASFEVWQ